jgi:small subunit ribosomal protein S20
VAKRTASARKQARASVGRTLRNRSVRSAVKTRVVRVRRAITEHAEGTVELGLAAIASLDRAASKGILHPNNAARRKSRLMKALAVAGEGAPAAAKPAKGKTAAKPAAKKAGAKKTTTARAAKPATKPAANRAARPAAKKR